MKPITAVLWTRTPRATKRGAGSLRYSAEPLSFVNSSNVTVQDGGACETSCSPASMTESRNTSIKGFDTLARLHAGRREADQKSLIRDRSWV
jgi:hypothetical protein